MNIKTMILLGIWCFAFCTRKYLIRKWKRELDDKRKRKMSDG